MSIKNKKKDSLINIQKTFKLFKQSHKTIYAFQSISI
jgi:hypothetical protein